MFHAIAKNDTELVEFLLDEEIDLRTKYQVNIYLHKMFRYSF